MITPNSFDAVRASLFVLTMLFVGCSKNGNNSAGAVNEGIISGCELTITCKAGIEEELNVSVLSGKSTEDFGVIGALPEREGGKTGLGDTVKLLNNGCRACGR